MDKNPIGQCISDRDEPLNIQVGYDDTRQLVVVVFNNPVSWFALTKESASMFAKIVEGHARFIKEKELQ